MMAALMVSLGVATVSVRPAAADPACDPARAEAETARIRALLDDQAMRARVWNLAWGIGFSMAAVGQLTFGLKPEWMPILELDDDTQKGMVVSAAKAAIGAGSRFILPLRIARVGGDHADPCAAHAAAVEALRVTARRQMRSFWLNHIGGIAVNLGAALVLGLAYDNWSTAALSVAVGYPVGVISTYSMPRGAWRAERNLERRPAIIQQVSIHPVVGPRYQGVSFALSF